MKVKTRKIVSSAISLILAGGIAAGAYFGYLKFGNQQKIDHNKNDNKLNSNANSGSGSTLSNNNTEPTLNKKSLHVMNWNVLNFGGGDNDVLNAPKINRISDVILHEKPDLIGFTEINYNNQSVRTLDNLKKLLNSSEKNESGTTWDYVISENDENPRFPNSKEHYAMFYKSNVLSVVKKESITKNNLYARPPFSVKFKTGNDYQFYYVIAHFDAPGVNAKNGETATDSLYGTNGSQEVTEAKSVKEYIFDKYKPENIDIIFGGDTNLTAKSQIIFDEFKKFGIENTYGDDFKYNNSVDAYKTSLSSKDGYANPYDKFLFLDTPDKGTIVKPTKEKFKFDIIAQYKAGGIWENLRVPDYNTWSKLKKAPRNQTPIELARKISDHAPINIFIDINEQ
ncbi:MnuA family membrane nuclease [Mycoplasma corogypsi]|uniref:MnuA family membrane nuclease n=1 Tax=Mycoplasma corogypsi TaxID=2106 RepID=UPI003872D2D1